MQKRRTNIEVAWEAAEASTAPEWQCVCVYLRVCAWGVLIIYMSDEKSIRERQKAHSIYFGPCKSVQYTTKMLRLI